MKNNEILYLDLSSGISGDMFVAAMIDLGVDEDKLQEALLSIKEDRFRVVISDTFKSGLKVKDFDVVLSKENDNHDHDMDYLYGHRYHDNSLEDYTNHHESANNNNNNNNNNEYSHHHGRGLFEVFDIIDKTSINDNTKNIAKKIFNILAKAESKAHGVEIDKVHFHEVGAIDSIVDIIAAAFCIDYLDIDEVCVPYIAEGKGTVRCQHGILPVPVPAVVNIVMESGIIINNSGVYGELITPTGAAIVSALITSNKLPEKYIIKKTGLGNGKRDYKTAGFVRAMLIEEV